MNTLTRIAFIVAMGNLALFLGFACVILFGESNNLDMKILGEARGLLGGVFSLWFIPEFVLAELTIPERNEATHFDAVCVFWTLFRILCLFACYFIADWVNKKRNMEAFLPLKEQNRKRSFLIFVKRVILILAFFNVLVIMFSIGIEAFGGVFYRSLPFWYFWFLPEVLLAMLTGNTGDGSFGKVIFFWGTVKMVFLFVLYFLLDMRLQERNRQDRSF